MLNCVPVIFYKMNWISEWIFRVFVKSWGGYQGPVGLPNILLGVKKRAHCFFPEYLGPEATPKALAEALYQLYSDEEYRERCLQKCEKVKEQFLLHSAVGTSASRSAAKILKWKEKPAQETASISRKNLVLYFVISLIWSSVNWVRRRMAHSGLFSVYVVQTPSILVGYLQAGGAGKTPLIIALAKEAIARGKKVAIISRGYGKAKELPLGDEMEEIKFAVPGVILAANADRKKAVQEVEKLKPDLILFDDGFQNLKFKAHVNLIAVTDRTRLFIPYRDFNSEIKFADFVVGTKGDHFNPQFSKNRGNFFKIEWKWIEPIDKPVWVLCSIADPQELVRFYGAQGLVIRKIISKGDHSPMNVQEVKELVESARLDGCVVAITEKDSVKIPTLNYEVYHLKRSIQNRDWIDAIFDRLQCIGSKSKMEKDESL